MGRPSDFAPTRACFKRSRWFGKRHKTDAFTKPAVGEPTIRTACAPQTVLDRHFRCLFCFFYQYLAIFPAVSLYPQQSVPTLRYTRRHLPSAVPWIYVVACILDVINSVCTSLRHCHLSFLRQDRTFSSVYEKTTNRRCTFLAKWHLLVVGKCCYW